MTFKKPLFASIAAIIVLTMGLTACGSNNNVTPSTTPSGSAPASSAAPSKPIKITMLGDDAMVMVGYETPEEAFAKFEADIKADPKNDNPNNRLKYDNLKYM